MPKQSWLTAGAMVLVSTVLLAQTPPVDPSIILPNSTNMAAQKLSKSLEENPSDQDVAAGYVELARELSNHGEAAKAEDYLNRALQLYLKIGDRELTAASYREVAKAQEAQHKFSQAASNYLKAASTTRKRTLKEINTNDANRLKNYDNPHTRSAYIQRNLDLLNQPSSIELSEIILEERPIAYQQMAQARVEMLDHSGGVKDLESALKGVEGRPEEALKLKREMASLFIADKKTDDAVAISQSMVKDAEEIRDPKLQIAQLQNLSHTYFETNQPTKGLATLEQAYELALAEGQTIEAKKTMQMLVAQHQKAQNPRKALEVYADFMDRLEGLIQGDPSLIDHKFFLLHEEKITQLEKERALKDELIAKKNRYNYVLLGSIILAILFMGLIARALMAIKKKNKRIALQSLRREMNPHFIFNSLNSINQFIAQNNELEANKYLSSYSKLMRNIMENSNKDFISLSTELEQMKEYLDLEHMRFEEKFIYHIEVDPELDADALMIPNMVIQPQLENAVWHGLRYLEGGGILTLTIRTAAHNRVSIVIEDNGIGIQKSQALKTKHQKQHLSRGMTNTRERINLLNNLYNTHITLELHQKTSPQCGVVVSISFPQKITTR